MIVNHQCPNPVTPAIASRMRAQWNAARPAAARRVGVKLMFSTRCKTYSLLARLHRHCASTTDAVVVGAGHNGLVAATLLAQQGLKVWRTSRERQLSHTTSYQTLKQCVRDTQVRVFEEKDTVGGACKTEYPFPRVPGLGTSTGALFATCACQLPQCFTSQGPQLEHSTSVCLQAHTCWE